LRSQVNWIDDLMIINKPKIDCFMIQE